MKKLILFSASLLTLCSCASFEGAYRGPEIIGRGNYNTEAPQVELRKKIKVVLLTFQDVRPSRQSLDWTRQAKVTDNSVGQPIEVRVEIEKALRTGLKRNPAIQLVSAEDFLKTRDADVVISGKIERCEAERNTRNFAALTQLEVVARDQFGNPYWKEPLHIRSRRMVEYKDTGYYDEIEPGKVAQAVNDSIEAVASELLNRRSLLRAFERAQSPADRELAAKDMEVTVTPDDAD